MSMQNEDKSLGPFRWRIAKSDLGAVLGRAGLSANERSPFARTKVIGDGRERALDVPLDLCLTALSAPDCGLVILPGEPTSRPRVFLGRKGNGLLALYESAENGDHIVTGPFGSDVATHFGAFALVDRPEAAKLIDITVDLSSDGLAALGALADAYRAALPAQDATVEGAKTTRLVESPVQLTKKALAAQETQDLRQLVPRLETAFGGKLTFEIDSMERGIKELAAHGLTKRGVGEFEMTEGVAAFVASLAYPGPFVVARDLWGVTAFLRSPEIIWRVSRENRDGAGYNIADLTPEIAAGEIQAILSPARQKTSGDEAKPAVRDVGVEASTCAVCAAPLTAGSKFCVACGAPVDTAGPQVGRAAAEGARAKENRFCTQCGVERRPNAKFCTNCGAAV